MIVDTHRHDQFDFDAREDSLATPPRSLESLIGERRSIVEDLRREHDKVIRAAYEYSIARIDDEIATRAR